VRNIKIVSSAKYLPKKKVTAKQMDKMLGVEEGWSLKKTGVEYRHYVDDENSISMGTIVLKEALKKANLEFEQLDALVGTCGTPAQAIPCTASLLQEAMGMQESGVPCFDVNSTCLSFVTAVDMISYAMEAKRYTKVAFVASEVASVGLNFNQKESSALFGDGAVCIIFEYDTTKTSGIIASHMETYSSGAHDAQIRAGGSLRHPVAHKDVKDTDFLFDMNGPKIFKLASKVILPFCEKLFFGTQRKIQDMKLVIPHQASLLSLNLIRKKLNLSQQQYMIHVYNHGNQIAASIPIGIHDAIEMGKIKRGDEFMVLGTSAGFSIGAIIFKF
jgi:3-oxoacyl-[acyl-carrier-protein] synthase-3